MIACCIFTHFTCFHYFLQYDCPGWVSLTTTSLLATAGPLWIRVKFEKVNIWKSKHFMLKVKIISSYEQICTCSSWFSFLSKQTISRPKYFDHWKDHCSYISSAYAVFWKHILDLGYLCYFHLSNVKVLNPPNNKFW